MNLERMRVHQRMPQLPREGSRAAFCCRRAPWKDGWRGEGPANNADNATCHQSLETTWWEEEPTLTSTCCTHMRAHTNNITKHFVKNKKQKHQRNGSVLKSMYCFHSHQGLTVASNSSCGGPVPSPGTHVIHITHTCTHTHTYLKTGKKTS